MEEELRCISCGSSHNLTVLLDMGLRDWQPTGLLLADCPTCNKPIELQIESGRVSVCELIGFGARPDVMFHQSGKFGSLVVERSPGEMKIHYEGRTWSVRPSN